MAVDGRTHEKRLVCMWVRGFLRHASASGLIVESSPDGAVYLVTVDWLQAKHDYAIDPNRESIQRVVSGEVRSLVPLDAEYDDPIFSVALRDALESRLGGEVDLYHEVNTGRLRECEELVDEGGFD